jgi:hypothetical protein
MACVAALALPWSPGAPAQNKPDEAVIAVVVAAGHGEPAALVPAAVANIFRRKRQFWGDRTPIVPVNLPAGHPLRRDFSQRVFGRSPQDLQAYWNDQYFHGVLPPAVLASEEAVLRFVVETPGAIGYVWSCNLDRRVLVVASLSAPGALAACAR